MFATIDGKILTRRWKKFPVAKSTASLYDSTAAEFGVGAWLIGTNSMREFFHVGEHSGEADVLVPPGDYIAKPDAETLAIAPDARGTIVFDANEVGGDHLVILISKNTSNAYRAHLRDKGISYLICGSPDVNLSEALTKLRTIFKLKKLLLEGGGLINGSMLQLGLIDEISQLVAPIVDGGGAAISGLYDLRDTASLHSAFALRLIEQRQLKHGVMWLRYRVQHPA
jgi:riboflavin biosynthesis pyrimidine reductase